MIIRHDRPEGLPPVRGYSHVTVGSGLIVHISGQVPVLADGTPAAGGITAQADQVFINLHAALASAGASWTDVVKMTYYLCDMDDLDAVRAVRDRLLDPDHLPASSLVQVVRLVHPDFRLEVDAVAVIDT